VLRRRLTSKVRAVFLGGADMFLGAKRWGREDSNL
jgi:hypothetical protein